MSSHTRRRAGARLALLLPVIVIAAACGSASAPVLAPVCGGGRPGPDRGADARRHYPARGPGRPAPVRRRQQPGAGRAARRPQDRLHGLARPPRRGPRRRAREGPHGRARDGRLHRRLRRVPQRGRRDGRDHLPDPGEPLGGHRGRASAGSRRRSLGEKTNAAEVGGQIVDLEARLRNLRASEQVLVGIAQGTGKVTDLLEVQQRISDVRGQIEQLDGQRAALEDQVAYGTLVTTYGLEVAQVEEAKAGWNPATDVDGASATLIGAAPGAERRARSGSGSCGCR